MEYGIGLNKTFLSLIDINIDKFEHCQLLYNLSHITCIYLNIAQYPDNWNYKFPHR